MKLKRMPDSNIIRFLSPYEDEVLLIIKTGWPNKYTVFWESAHDGITQPKIMNLEQIKEEYNIEIHENVVINNNSDYIVNIITDLIVNQNYGFWMIKRELKIRGISMDKKTLISRIYNYKKDNK